jgi:predicted Zn-dependent peptidase
VSKKKNSYVCRKTFYQTLFGVEHILASFTEKEDIQGINRETLTNFYQKNILNGFKYAIISGNISHLGIASFSRMLASSDLKMAIGEFTIPLGIRGNKNTLIAKNESVQSSIRIGTTTINRKHKNFRKLQFLNLIFGGYFGSRLMKNIREDKGLTYGIYSVIEPYKDFSIWYLDCEINYKNRNKGIEEIRKEINKIKEEPIPLEELENAKNYYLGSFLKSLDGPFSLADRLKIIIDNELSPAYYAEFVELLNTINSKDLQEIAQEYFVENNMLEIIVGKE